MGKEEEQEGEEAELHLDGVPAARHGRVATILAAAAGLLLFRGIRPGCKKMRIICAFVPSM